MNLYLFVFIGTLITFASTCFGALFVLFFKKINPIVEKLTLAFAGGIMLAASVWSLIIPSFNLVNENHYNYPEFVPALVGISIGVLFLLGFEKLVLYFENRKYKTKNKIKQFTVNNTIIDNKQENKVPLTLQTNLLMFAITIHNVPEGASIGLVLEGSYNNGDINLASAISIVLGMSLQNIPEGAAVALPLRQMGFNKWKAFLYGVISGIVEPIAGMLSILLANFVSIILPFFLNFAAGAMIFVVVQELIPQSIKEGNIKDNTWTVLMFMVGFILMMVLDVGIK